MICTLSYNVKITSAACSTNTFVNTKADIFYFNRENKYLTKVKLIQDCINEDLQRSLGKISILLIKSNVKTLHINSITNLPDLSMLTLSSINLESIKPGALQDLNSLETLILSENKLKTIEEKTFTFCKVKTIDLSNNLIATIQKNAFYGTPMLETLLLNDNKLPKFDPQWFHQFVVSITSLQLHNNQIRNISTTTFIQFEQLETLTLSSNTIEAIDSDSFVNTKLLSTMEIANNSLTDISFLKPLTELKTVDLGFNRIMFVNKQMVSELLLLQTLDLSYNPLKCSCYTNFVQTTPQIIFMQKPEVPVCIIPMKSNECNNSYDENGAKRFMEMIKNEI